MPLRRKYLRISDLNQRISILHRPTGTDGSFGRTVAASDWATASTSGPFWAEITALQGYELSVAMQKWADARFRIRMRFQSGVTIKRADRITWGSRTLEILDAEDPTNEQIEFVMHAKEYTA